MHNPLLMRAIGIQLEPDMNENKTGFPEGKYVSSFFQEMMRTPPAMKSGRKQGYSGNEMK
jgi:hypothetical protein